MSKRELDELGGFENVTLREKLDTRTLVFRQIERCNNAVSNPDPAVFEAHVRALLAMLPANKRDAIKGVAETFTSKTARYMYKSFCGQNIGTPENPMIDEETGETLSPILVEEEVTDYEALYEIILNSLQKAGLTWSVESKFAEYGKVMKSSKIPNNILMPIEKSIVKALAEVRTNNPKLRFKPETNYYTILNALTERYPFTPIFERRPR